MNIGHCPDQLKKLFTEVMNVLGKDHAKNGSIKMSKTPMCLKKSMRKDTKKKMLLHQEHHPKDVSF